MSTAHPPQGRGSGTPRLRHEIARLRRVANITNLDSPASSYLSGMATVLDVLPTPPIASTAPDRASR